MTNAITDNRGLPFLKWAGGKRNHLDVILPELYTGERGRLIIPFLGAGAVYLAAEFDKYMVADVNIHLVNLWARLAAGHAPFMVLAKLYFDDDLNNVEQYLEKRKLFNNMARRWDETGRVAQSEQDAMAHLFLYLNRHCYNGLTRFNKKGEFNVGFGKYKKPYFPEQEMIFFLNERSEKSLIGYADFEPTMLHCQPGEVIFCDPPYVGVFASYHKAKFLLADHKRLNRIAKLCAHSRGCKVVVCGLDNDKTREVYADADRVITYDSARAINSNGKGRGKVGEALYIYEARDVSDLPEFTLDEEE